MKADDYLYRPPAPLVRRGVLANMPAWGWAVILLGTAVVLQLSAATFLILAFGPKQHDNPSLCQSNIRKLASALTLYCQDYDGCYPPAQSWMNVLLTVRPDESLFKCPGVQESDIFAFGYAFNDALGQMSRATITSPASTELVYDSARTRRNASDSVTSLPHPPRHRGHSPGVEGMLWGNYIAYADGRVALVPITHSKR